VLWSGWLARRARPLLWISEELLDELTAQANRERPNETGGMLLGWHAEGQSVLAAAIGAGPGARSERDSLLPDGPWQQHRLEEAYEQSGRRITYLGDWHSHPRGPARPSARDRDTAALVARCAAARAPEPLTAIIGRHAGRWRLRCFIYIDGRMRRMRVRIDAPARAA
jgi:integrative and conjugative element protein (TIGR02256 family)